jgi:hypothetical protein
LLRKAGDAVVQHSSVLMEGGQEDPGIRDSSVTANKPVKAEQSYLQQ